MDHSELVAEMPNVERLSVQERLHLARRRRLQQLRSWSHNEKEWIKRRNSQTHNTIRSTTNRKIKFNNSVVLLEAAARNDIDEGILNFFSQKVSRPWKHPETPQSHVKFLSRPNK